MKPLRIFLLSALLILAVSVLGQDAKTAAGATTTQAQGSQAAPTLAAAIDGEISAVEKQVLDAAEAMPEDKFNFSPESLSLPSGNYKGVRTFAVQVKHIAASNYFIWSGLTGDKLPANLKDGNGPEDVKTKAEILMFLKDSFALGHRAAATLTIENMVVLPMQPERSTCLPRPGHGRRTAEGRKSRS